MYQSYSFGVDHQFAHGIAVKVGYVGGHGRNIYNSGTNINQLGEQYFTPAQAAGLKAAPASFKYLGVGSFSTNLAKITTAQTLAPFPQYQITSGGIADSVSTGVSDYNSLDVKVQKSFSRGITVLGAYTWSSNWDNLWGASSTLNPGNNGPQDVYNLHNEYARAINDIPNRASIAITYDLPFGKGKQFLGGANRLVDLVVGGSSTTSRSSRPDRRCPSVRERM
jgi:hypothetical protein